MPRSRRRADRHTAAAALCAIAVACVRSDREPRAQAASAQAPAGPPSPAPVEPSSAAPVAADPAAPAVPRGFQRFEQRLFTIALPPGWERVRYEDSGRRNVLGAENLVRFEDGRGKFFAVIFDHAGSGFSADAVWRFEASPGGDGVVLVEEEPPCRTPTFSSSEEAVMSESADCPRGDGRLRLAGVGPELHGHRFFFYFGDDAREEGVELRPFREILRTFRAR